MTQIMKMPKSAPTTRTIGLRANLRSRLKRTLR
jgi:hypothetical protein